MNSEALQRMLKDKDLQALDQTIILSDLALGDASCAKDISYAASLAADGAFFHTRRFHWPRRLPSDPHQQIE